MRIAILAVWLLPLVAQATESDAPGAPDASTEPGAPNAASAPTAPDVLHGERYDGRPAQPPRKQPGRALARALLTPPRLFIAGLGAVAKPAMEWNERDHVQQHITAALTSDDGLIGVRPVVNYEASFTPSFGLLLFDNRLPAGMRSQLSSAFGGPHVLANDARLSRPLPHQLQLTVHADYLRRNDELYTGIGMHVPLPFSRYGFDRVDSDVALTWKPVKALQIEAGVAVDFVRYNNGSEYDGDQSIGSVYCLRAAGHCVGVVDDWLVPGFSSGTQFVREHVAINVDSRADELSSGLLVGARVDYTHGIGSDDSSYLRLHGHIGRSFELFRHRSLYIGISAEDEIALGGSTIPFSELVQLGGIDDLRGFRRARFRDDSSLLGTIEYRWPIWMWMDGSLFADYGGVFKPQFADFTVHDLKPDVGFGFRMHSANKYTMRIQFAYGFGATGGGGVRLVFAGNGNPS